MMIKKQIQALAFAALVAGCATERIAPAYTAETAGANQLKVAVYAGPGPSGIGAVEWYRIVRDSPEMTLKLVDGAGVSAGALEGQDLFVMPGGSSRGEYASLGTNGVEKMKDFIRSGGAYLGTCAGCCLLMDGDRRARVMPWNYTGSENALFYPYIAVNEKGAEALSIAKGRHKVRFHGGPFLWPTTNRIEGAAFELWGTLDSEATYRGQVKREKKMYGAGAIVGGTYGKGRVFVTSLHPEYYASTHYLVTAAIRWLTGRTVEIPRAQRRPGDLALGYVVGKIRSVKDAETALRVSALDGINFQAVNSDDIWTERLAHLDVLVMPCGVTGKADGQMRKAIDGFLARGGRLFTLESKATPAGAVACASADELVGAIEKVRDAVKMAMR